MKTALGILLVSVILLVGCSCAKAPATPPAPEQHIAPNYTPSPTIPYIPPYTAPQQAYVAKVVNITNVNVDSKQANNVTVVCVTNIEASVFIKVMLDGEYVGTYKFYGTTDHSCDIGYLQPMTSYTGEIIAYGYDGGNGTANVEFKTTQAYAPTTFYSGYYPTPYNPPTPKPVTKFWQGIVVIDITQ